jgi:hypothetical protein
MYENIVVEGKGYNRTFSSPFDKARMLFPYEGILRFEGKGYKDNHYFFHYTCSLPFDKAHILLVYNSIWFEGEGYKDNGYTFYCNCSSPFDKAYIYESIVVEGKGYNCTSLPFEKARIRRFDI